MYVLGQVHIVSGISLEMNTRIIFQEKIRDLKIYSFQGNIL